MRGAFLPPAELSTGRIVMGRAQFCLRVYPFCAHPRETPETVCFQERGMVGGYLLTGLLPVAVAGWLLAYPVHTAVTGGRTLPFWPVGAALATLAAVSLPAVLYVRWRRRTARIGTPTGDIRVEVRTLRTRASRTFPKSETWILLHPVVDHAMQKRPRRYCAALLWTPAGHLCLGFDPSEDMVRTWLRNLPPAISGIRMAAGAPITIHTVWGGARWRGEGAADG